MLRSFVSEKFIPSRMAVSVVADIGPDNFEKKLQKMIGDAFPQDR